MRKLAAIMFTDIVGYSALMSKDESSALQVLERNREIQKATLRQHNGEFIKEIGDGTLSIFQSSWDAVNCAASIQQSLAVESSFQLRIGIHIGDIVISDNDVFGDGVNIASRIESLCEPGGICITERVYEDIHNKIGFDAAFIGEKTLKNISQPIIIYSISPAELQKILTFPQDPDKAYVTNKPVQGQKKIVLRKRSKQIILILSILVLIISGYFIFRPFVMKAMIPSEPRPIAVISFENQTGDSNFDYLQKAIPNLLITSLEQSNLFHVITWERMQDLLSQMGKKNIKNIDTELGFEICRREGCNLIVIGSYVKAGETFVTDAKVLDVKTKQLLKSVSAKGTGVASILQSQIDYLSKEISRSAGHPSMKIETAGLHVIDVTTNSMAAYDYFLKGRDASDKLYYDDARKYFEEAVRIDSTFAVAWLYLSNAYGSLENTQMRNEAIEKAYVYSSRATEKEQLSIKAVYARIIKNDPGEEYRVLSKLAGIAPKEKRVYYDLGLWYKTNNNAEEAINQFNKAIDLDPQYGKSINLLAYLYLKKGDLEKALDYFRRYAALNPDDANPHDSMGDLLWQMGKLDEAIAEFKKALEIKPDFYISGAKIAYIYCMKEDYAEADKWMSRTISIAPSPGTKAIWYWAVAWIKYWCGSLSQADTYLDQSYKLAVTQDNFLTIAGVEWFSALTDMDMGKYDSGKEHYLKAFQILIKNSTSPKNDSAAYNLFAGTFNIGKGRVDSARWCLDNIKRLMQEIEEPQLNQARYWYHCLSQEVFLSEKKYDSVIIENLMVKPLEIPEFTFPQALIYNVPFYHDYLARAYTGLGRTDEAISEYERLITFNPNGNDRRLINPKYHYFLALLYEKKGLKDKAIEQYRKFLELWKNADSIFAEHADATKRLNNLVRH